MCCSILSKRHWDSCDSLRVFGELSYESVEHLFISCSQTLLVLKDIFRWLSFELVPSHSIFGLLGNFLGISVGKQGRLGWLLIWHDIVQTIWNNLIYIIFLEGTFYVEYLLNRVKLISRKWFLVNPDTPSFDKWGMYHILYWNR
jgi:hypothetical protein